MRSFSDKIKLSSNKPSLEKKAPEKVYAVNEILDIPTKECSNITLSKNIRSKQCVEVIVNRICIECGKNFDVEYITSDISKYKSKCYECTLNNMIKPQYRNITT